MNETDFRSESLIFFDGYCNFCNRCVQFVLKHERKAYFKFSSLQSDFSIRQLSTFKIPEKLESVVVLSNDKLFFKSDAALEIVRQMKWYLGWLYFLKLLPRPFRDLIYDFFANNRYKWFGRRDSCGIPDSEFRSRFL